MDQDVGVLARGVTRSFGRFQALRGMDLTVPYGEVTALVGANGAGKTTLMLVLATLLAPDPGTAEVKVAGYDLRTHSALARASLGWMPDTFGVYDRLTAVEYLEFFAAAYRVPRADAATRIAELLERVHLVEFARQPVHVLSRGQKQRLGLARALVHRPKVLLLDEPASGLDPRSRVELRDLLRGLAAEGCAVLVSSHILNELEEIADRVVLVDQGRTAGEHDLATLLASASGIWRIRALDEDALGVALDRRSVPHRIASGTPGVDAGPLTEQEAASLLTDLVGDGVRIVSYAPVGGVLESVYLAMTEDRR
ncbi:ABC transporter ATP-binding protein [Actinocorallia longicatena]|uniref:ABC transporter ATP-binding protein n=1 Tax=Actinocorallia longicatena TaxID=111803 RepID=A0ABP6Q5M6_9ACTN